MSTSNVDRASYTRYSAYDSPTWIINCFCGAFLIAIIPLLVKAWLDSPVPCTCPMHHFERVPFLSPEYRDYDPEAARPDVPPYGSQPVKETLRESIATAVSGGGRVAIFYFVCMLPVWGPLSRGWRSSARERFEAKHEHAPHLISSADCSLAINRVFPLLFVCGVILVELFQMLTTRDLQPGSYYNFAQAYLVAGKYALTTMLLAALWSGIGQLIHTEGSAPTTSPL